MNIFDYSNYRSFLCDYLKNQPKKGHGLRSKWATAIGCQVAYVSHVMNEKNDFSLEQIESLSRHLGLSKEETEFFIFLAEKERAGTIQLKNFFTNILQEKIKLREDVRNRMKIKENLSIEDQAVYYSKWYYSAIHMALTIPSLQTGAELSKYFNLSLTIINDCLHFLETKGMIRLSRQKYIVVGAFLHLSRNSPLFYAQQNFYRHKAIESIFRNSDEDLHFASCFSISESDVKKVKDVLLSAIEKSTNIIKPSKEEKIYAICMDYFEFK